MVSLPPPTSSAAAASTAEGSVADGSQGATAPASTHLQVFVDGSGRGRALVTEWVCGGAAAVARLPREAAERLARATWSLLGGGSHPRRVELAMRLDQGMLEIRFGDGPGDVLLYVPR